MPPRLLPGAHLYPVDDGTWRHRDGDGRFLRIRGQDKLLKPLQQLLHGHPAPDGEEVGGSVLTALENQGLLVQPQPRRDLSQKQVVLEGETSVAQLVHTLLAAQVNIKIVPLDRAIVEESDLVISCAGWLSDRHWAQVDEWCSTARVPWHRCCLDGRYWVLGPLSWPGRTASYADTRARTLAAAAHADELLAYWNYLDTSGWLPTVPATPAGTVAVVAGHLVADVLAALSGEDVPSESDQILIDIQSCSVHRHPVLALPAVWTHTEFEPGECP